MTMNKSQPPISNAPDPANAAMPGALSEPPSDIELMQYFDGELEEPRCSAVAAFIGADLSARNKLAGMRITSAIVQNQATSISAADDIADLVLARIATEGPIVASHGAEVIPIRAAAERRPAATPTSPVAASAVQARPPANDNGRRIFALAAFAVAAAAALAIWGKLDNGPGLSTRSEPVAVMTAPGAPTSLDTTGSAEPEIDGAALTPDGDMEHGVEVAAVNFGAHMGSIFYVPSDSAMGARPMAKGSADAQRTTTVVWLTDDAGE